ncbi:MAG: winged helix-turn-helix transcriptional regulator [Nitrososphaerota archaeon]|nr:winged helix-turn-helix transcriptional regulator [Candidatus Calditenuis fumarioli]
MEGWAIRRDLVLVALLEGPKTLSELSRVTGLSRSELEATLLSLKVAGLVLEQEARGLIRRKTVYSLTEQGRKEAKEARSRIERIAQEVTQKVEEGDDEGLEELLTAYVLFLPLLMHLHLLDVALLQQLGDINDWAPEGEKSGDELEDTWI